MIKNKPLRIIITIILCFAIAFAAPMALTIAANYFLILIKAKVWSDNIPWIMGRMISVVELYKDEFGYYPATLRDIERKPYSSEHIAIGHILLKFTFCGRLFRIEYKLSDNGESYYFFSRGFDNKPYTEDDLQPDMAGIDDLSDFFPGYVD